MSANWVVAAKEWSQQNPGSMDLLGATLGFANTLSGSLFSRAMGGINDRMTREQIKMASEADANARIRATQGLISSQRAALGASGIAGGRTARLIEARTRINANREQRQADQSATFATAASRINRVVNRAEARSAAWKGGQDLLVAGLKAGGFGR